MNPTNLRWFTVTESREVMEVRADNLDEVAAWCGGRVDPSPEGVMGCVEYPTVSGLDGVAVPDDVIVKDRYGFCVSMYREEFKRDVLPGWTEETT